MLWIKALHLVFGISWFAGLFYLPRLFVYLAACEHEGTRQQLQLMARRLYRFSSLLMVLSLAFGLWLVLHNPALYMKAGWFHAKLTLLVLLVGYHHICARFLRQFEQGVNRHNALFYRIFNEAVALFLLAIVLLAVVKPF